MGGGERGGEGGRSWFHRGAGGVNRGGADRRGGMAARRDDGRVGLCRGGSIAGGPVPAGQVPIPRDADISRHDFAQGVRWVCASRRIENLCVGRKHIMLLKCMTFRGKQRVYMYVTISGKKDHWAHRHIISTRH